LVMVGGGDVSKKGSIVSVRKGKYEGELLRFLQGEGEGSLVHTEGEGKAWFVSDEKRRRRGSLGSCPEIEKGGGPWPLPPLAIVDLKKLI